MTKEYLELCKNCIIKMCCHEKCDELNFQEFEEYQQELREEEEYEIGLENKSRRIVDV